MELAKIMCYNTHMKPSMYARYKLELENVYTIETDYGFCNYKVESINEASVEIYLQEVYVLPECRGNRKASVFADLSIKDAENRFKVPVSTIYTTVAVAGNNVEKSLRAITDYGFKLCAANTELIYFKKGILHE